MRLQFMLSLLIAASAAANPANRIPAIITAALADPARPASQVALDAVRRPAEIIVFAGLRPGERIADFMSGNGYFTRLLSKVAGPVGRVYAFLPEEQLATCSPTETAGTRELAGDERYRNVTLMTGAADRFTVAAPLDMVWFSLGYHDLHDKFMAPTNVVRLNAAIFRALKPGGLFIVIDHAAAAGTGLRDTESLHRIDPAALRSEITAAGFVFEGESNVLRNPQDDHLLPVFDPAIRHRTDQVVYKFRKPRRQAFGP
jgi:predicted methyltransferase